MNNKPIQTNQQRLSYLLELFSFTKKELLEYINGDGKRVVKEEEVFDSQIKLSVLKRIDAVFKQGLSFYTDPSEIEKKRDSSIFLRKDSFNAQVNFGDRLRVNVIERDSRYLNTLAQLSDYRLAIPSSNYSTGKKPQEVAFEARNRFYPQVKNVSDRDFLKAFINKLSEQNIMVSEFVENHNLKNKTSIDGLFIKPNIIAVKRQQDSFKREIFTLAHELGHYLRNQEELDQPVVGQLSEKKIEQWCDSFAFSFLIGQEGERKLLASSELSLTHPTIIQITNEQHLSRLAIFTNLVIHKNISWEEYNGIRQTLKEEYEKQKREKERLKMLKKEKGEKGGQSPKPIRSSIEQDIYRHAFLSGVIGEYEVLKRFGSKDIDKVIYG